MVVPLGKVNAVSSHLCLMGACGMQCEAASQAMQVKMNKALLEQQKLQELLEKERSAFRASMITQSDDRKDATWKSKLMKLRTELEHAKQERDSFKRQCIR